MKENNYVGNEDHHLCSPIVYKKKIVELIETIPESEDHISPTHLDYLSRLSVYCTSNSYKTYELINWLDGLKQERKTYPKQFYDVIYTHYLMPSCHNPCDLFFFEYGVVVFWNCSAQEENLILSHISGFEVESISSSERYSESYKYFIKPGETVKISDDVIQLGDGNFISKLAASHALAQSSKLSLFEKKMDYVIESNRSIPLELMREGNITMERKTITSKIGQLYAMRMNVNLVSNVLDVPEIFWQEPNGQNLYQHIRGYLEISQRISILNQRCEVLGDMLGIFREHLTSFHCNCYFELIY
ncbi:DUF155-domain-containing protein [Rozella allomycis CSF55]|uniref:DUF155-domain-containing protein n=1 Tax=Rozella allomycis (strain CSF55) TaxID=988480 RepID=A0A075AWJ1_ROZAC|nr:Protein of unknown function DUF155 domain-containing protein [Rozella allomycis CSF55]RKP21709.1 DUF155-domain-containing protein [Rozella allomycis CSF55]|eukprot:EPZ34527.1 Protein of unknown function DUF155 domain-containing protein [Rozella allomycis CSF55]